MVAEGGGARIAGGFGEVTEINGVAGAAIGSEGERGDEVEAGGGVGGRGELKGLPGIGVGRSGGVGNSVGIKREIAGGDDVGRLAFGIGGGFVDVSGETLQGDGVLGVTVGDAGVELYQIFVGILKLVGKLGIHVAVGGDGPVHTGDGDEGIGGRGAAFGVEEVKVDDVAGFKTDVNGFGAGGFYISGEGAVGIDGEPAGELGVKAADVKDELVVQKDPNVVVAGEVKAFGAVGSDFDRDAEVGGEVEVVTGAGGAVVGAEIYVIQWEDAGATISVGVVAGAGESDFAFVALGEFGVMEPAVEVVGGLDGVMAGDVAAGFVDAGGPGFGSAGVGGDGETIGAELVLDQALLGGAGGDITHGPLKLAVFGAAFVLALVPIGDGDGDGFGVAEGGNFPGGGDAVFVGDALKREGLHD